MIEASYRLLCHKKLGNRQSNARKAMSRFTSSTLALALLALLSIPAIAFARGGGHSGYHSYGSGRSSSSVHVNGYSRRSGSYVAPHFRTAPDHTKFNNWSSKGNVNPYTGK